MNKFVKKYLAIAKIFFKAQIIYRFDVAMTALEAISRVLFAWLIWGAVFAERETVSGFYFETMLLYYVISSFIATLDIGFGVSGEIAHEIRNGSFSKFMVIPVNPHTYWLGQNSGVVSYLALFVLPVAIVCGLLFGAGGFNAGQPAGILLGLVMIPLGLAFMLTYHFFIGLLAFKFQDVGMFLHVQGTIIQFTQGAIIPLTLLPDTAFHLISFLPFPHVVFTPTMLLIGKMDLYNGLASLGILALWTVGMAVAAQLTYHRLRIKYDGVGV